MTGHRKTGRRGQITRYYQCTHDHANPRDTAAHPTHPATVAVRDGLMQAHLAEFFNTRVFGPTAKSCSPPPSPPPQRTPPASATTAPPP